MIFILIVYYLECQEDVDRLSQCLSRLPEDLPHLAVGHACPPLRPGPGIALAENSGKAKAANLGLQIIATIFGRSQIIAVLDGDILLPPNVTVYFETAEMVLSNKSVDILVPDQVGDRRHSCNIPCGSGPVTVLPSSTGLAGGCMLFRAEHRFPQLGSGYQPEDVVFLRGKRVAFWPAFQVLHPYALSAPLRMRQRLRFGFTPAPCSTSSFTAGSGST